MGGMMSGNHMAQCGAMNAKRGRDHAACAQEMREGTHQECASMGMTPEECQAMHERMSAGTMALPATDPLPAPRSVTGPEPTNLRPASFSFGSYLCRRLSRERHPNTLNAAK